jgi:hypothetical protein
VEGAGFSLSVPNICVKLPGDEGAEDATGAATGAASGADAENGGAGAAGANAGGAGAGDGFSLNVPNICVKLPGGDAGAGGALAAGLGSGAGAAGGSGFASCEPCFSSDASRSSSARGGVGETVPNIPVALDEPPPPEPLEPGGSELSKGARGASIQGPP